MKKKKIIISGCVVILALLTLFTGLLIIISITKKTENKASVYIWSIDEIDFSCFEEAVDYANIGTIYLSGDATDFHSERYSLFFASAKQKNLETFAIYGENHEDFNKNLTALKTLADQVATFNKTSDYKLSGIAVDWEFHTSPSYASASKDERRTIFKRYTDIMTEARGYSNEKNLQLVACIPSDYETLGKDTLERLIKDGCDYIQIMNYRKATAVEDIATETQLAEKYGKIIESIAELQAPNDRYEVTDDITFYNDGFDKCLEKFEEIRQAYNYDRLKFCYHFYTPLCELINDKLN